MAERNTRRAVVRKARVNATRMDSFICDYIKHKNREIYNEAKQVYDSLRNRYSHKLHLKLTKEYMYWKDNPESNIIPVTEQALTSTLTPVLRIPLMDTNNIGIRETAETRETAEAAEKEPAETLERVVEEVLGEGTIQPSLNDVIPDDLLSQIIKELQNDSETCNIFSAVQDEFDIGDIEIDDIDDSLLEKEIYW